jgi:hypothetical protein
MKKKKEIKAKSIEKKKDTEEKKVTTPYTEMGDKEMESLFLELYYSPQWQAILKFNRIHHNSVIATLSIVDPFKNPTQAARAQGTDIGLFTLEAKVNNIVEQNK